MKFFKSQYQEGIKRFIFNEIQHGVDDENKPKESKEEKNLTEKDKTQRRKLQKNVKNAEEELEKFDANDKDGVKEGDEAMDKKKKDKLEKKGGDKEQDKNKNEKREKLVENIAKEKLALAKFDAEKGLTSCALKGSKVLNDTAIKLGENFNPKAVKKLKRQAGTVKGIMNKNKAQSVEEKIKGPKKAREITDAAAAGSGNEKTEAGKTIGITEGVNKDKVEKK